MHPLVPYIWASGVLHLIVASVNFVAPRMLEYRANLARVSPIVRQIFIVHSVYIVMNLVAFAGVCFFFAPELAGGSLLGTVISGYMAVFWLLRLVMQLFYYDPEAKKPHPFANIVFAFAFAYMAATSALAALGGLK